MTNENEEHDHGTCGTPDSLAVANLASHTLRREEGVGHAAADELSLRNAIIKQCRGIIIC